MRKAFSTVLVLAAISALLSMVLVALTTAASARNVREYQCGPVSVTASILKDAGLPVAYQIIIERKLADLPDGARRFESGTFVFREIDDPIAYFLNGKRYRCKEIPDAPTTPTDEPKR